MKFCFISSLVLAFTFVSLVASSYDYPVHIEELGNVIVTQPIIDSPPEGYEVIKNDTRICRLDQRNPATRPELAFASLESIALYFKSRDIVNKILANDREFNLNLTDRTFIQVLKFHADHFNPSIFEDVHEPEQIIIFGTIFLRTFKAAYPGLRNVRITKADIAELALLSTSWFMDIEEANEDLDVFVIRCAEFYHPNRSRHNFNWNTTLAELYGNDHLKLTFQAVVNLNVFRIPNRSILLFNHLKSDDEDLYLMMRDKDLFLKLISGVRYINSLSSDDAPHILLYMIREGLFYEEPFISFQADLKAVHFTWNNYENFKDFYSEALYYALNCRNSEAVRFLLNLDYDEYFVRDNDAISVDSDYGFFEVEPISLEDFNHLRAIFFGTSFLEIITAVPNLLTYGFKRITLPRMLSMRVAPYFTGLKMISEHLSTPAERNDNSLKRKASEIN